MKAIISLLFTFITINCFAQQWQTNGVNIYNTNSGYVGIGTSSPTNKLHLLETVAATTTLPLKLQNGNNSINSGVGMSFHADGNYTGAIVYLNRDQQAGPRHSLRFTVNGGPGGGVNALTIQDTGNVGIGTTAPAGLLDVNSSFHTATGKIIVRSQNGSMEGGEITLAGAGSYNVWNIDNYGGTFRLQHSGAEYVRVASNGNFGLGTTNPAYKLTVVGGALSVSHSGNQRLLISQNLNNDGSAIFNNSAAIGDIKFQMSGSDNVIIKRNGNVGIGTTTPDAQLTVKGTIHTQEVKVDLNGAVAPDYVFADDYSLPELRETEAYIQANKHLPGIPSAAEMEQEGINLKEMNLKLLEKVEELTLHLIELQKENEAQKELNKKQQEQLDALLGKSGR